MEALITEEVKEVLDWMSQTEGTPVSVNRKFSLAVANALLTIMTGKRYKHDDAYLKNLLDTTAEYERNV
jgi:hypothetical protein